MLIPFHRYAVRQGLDAFYSGRLSDKAVKAVAEYYVPKRDQSIFGADHNGRDQMLWLCYWIEFKATPLLVEAFLLNLFNTKRGSWNQIKFNLLN